MQDLFSFVPPTSPAPLAPSTTNLTKSEGSNGSFEESFFSIILGQFATTQEQPSLEVPTELSNASALDLTTLNQESKSIDEHLLEDLLGVVNALQENSQTTTFPTLNASPTLEKLLASETTRQEFANVKSVSDLMDLSKKYNLGLEKISISQESIESLQTKFPTLAKNNFFEDLKTALQAPKPVQQTSETAPQTLTTNTVVNLLDKQSTKPEEAPKTASLLSEIMSKESPKETAKPAEVKTEIKPEIKPTVIEAPTKVEVNEKQQTSPIIDETTVSQQIDTKAKNLTEEALKTIQTTTEETKQKTTTIPIEQAIKKVAHMNQENKKVEQPLHVEENQNETFVTVSSKLDKTSLENISSETTLTSTKVEKKSEDILEDESGLNTKRVFNEEMIESNASSEEATSNTFDIKNDAKTTLKQDISSKTAAVKESLNQFANDLKEKIEAYKPPVMKVELALSPKNLGEVDVTLLTRGNNLHVNISSNTVTMNLFTQNQAEVKSALVNMGFTNLEMNSSDQRNSEQSQQNQKQNGTYFDELSSNESPEEETALLEIVIPQYV